MFFYDNVAIGFLDGGMFNNIYNKFASPATLQELSESVKTEDEYLYAFFRALSQGIAVKQTNTGPLILDFSTPGVVKDATPFYNGVTIYPNHEHNIERWKGIILDSVWSENHKEVEQPGVNVHVRLWRGVDQKGNVICPDDWKTAKGVEDGVLKHVSTGLMYSYSQSHPVAPKDFFSHMGEKQDDGTPLRLIINSIRSVFELSLVVYGADKTAQRITEMAVSNGLSSSDIRATLNTKENALEYFSPKKFFFLSQDKDPNELYTPLPSEKEQLKMRLETLSKDLASLDKLMSSYKDSQEVTMDQIDEMKKQKHEQQVRHREELSILHNNLQESNEQVDTLRKTILSMQEDAQQAQSMVDLGEKYLDLVRAQTIQAYGCLCATSPDPTSDEEKASTIELIKTAPFDMVLNMQKTFTSRAVERIPRHRVSQARLDASKSAPVSLLPRNSGNSKFFRA